MLYFSDSWMMVRVRMWLSPRLPLKLRIPFAAMAIVLCAQHAVAACLPANATPCENCFAVFIMPDTQWYTVLAGQPKRGNHLDLVTRYICDHRTAWTEPSTAKQMPILMVLHLGDIVQSGDLNEGAGGGPLAQWIRADAAFDKLDSCSPTVPYLVTLGNHDLDGFNYEGKTDGYNTYFGADRWTSQGYACGATGSCDWEAGQWFLGTGDPIDANSRNQIGSGNPGPAAEQPARHRIGRIEAPNGQEFIFMGLDLALDFPPRGTAGEGDDLAWPNKILDRYPHTPTIVFHHSMFWSYLPPETGLRFGPEVWHSDSLTEPPPSAGPEYGTVGGMRELYDILLAPRPQVRFIFSGHVVNPTHQADFTIPRDKLPPIWGFLRNYQIIDIGDGEQYGAGWNVIAVFDPDAQEVRVRSYRIDDEEAYSAPPVNLLHAGNPVETECMDMDQAGFPERVISWNFRAANPIAPSLSTPGSAAVSALVLGSAMCALRGRRARSRA